MSGYNFKEFIKKIQKDLNPFKIRGRVQRGVCSKICNLEFCWELEVDPMGKVVQNIKSSTMPSLDIFGFRDGSIFELQKLSNF
jgi:hypothetical protein